MLNHPIPSRSSDARLTIGLTIRNSAVALGWDAFFARALRYAHRIVNPASGELVGLLEVRLRRVGLGAYVGQADGRPSAFNNRTRERLHLSGAANEDQSQDEVLHVFLSST